MNTNGIDDKMSSISRGGKIIGNTTYKIDQDKDNHDNNMERNTIDSVTKRFKGDNANIGARSQTRNHRREEGFLKVRSGDCITHGNKCDNGYISGSNDH